MSSEKIYRLHLRQPRASLPGEKAAQAFLLWKRNSMDTYDIAKRLKVHESLVYNAIAQLRRECEWQDR